MPNIFISGISQDTLMENQEAMMEIFVNTTEFNKAGVRFYYNPLIEIRNGAIDLNPVPYIEVCDGGQKPQENYNKTALEICKLFESKNLTLPTINFTTLNPQRYYVKGNPLK